MSNESIVGNLLNGIEFDDPRLYDLINFLTSDLYSVFNELHPPTTSAFGFTGQVFGPPAVSGFTATIFSNNVNLRWNSSGALFSYEIRYLPGSKLPSDWDIATSILTTSTLSADINPLTIPLVFGDHTFFIKAIDTAGTLSTVAATTVFNIPVITAPSISTIVISNNVLLSWTTPVSAFAIDHYNVYKNGLLQGSVSGTFEAIFEVAGGTFSYIVEAVDIVGNVGTPSSAAVVQVTSPSDFTLSGQVLSTFTGTKVNCVTETNAGILYLLACVNTTETYQAHFTGHSWNTPQDQVNAGYAIYIEPSLTTGSYQEVFDFGSIVTNVLVVMAWSITPIVGTVSVATSTVETSTDGVSWSSPVMGASAFAASVRYVRFTMNFVGSSDKALAYFSNLKALLNIHRELDSGSGVATATDVGGTAFFFNKAFRTVDSITVTPISTTACFPVIDFAGGINPTSFKVLLFDNAGVRLTRTIQWICRGVL